MAITKDLLFLYHLGCIKDDETIAYIEAARDSDPVVAHFLQTLDPDSVDPPEAITNAARSFANTIALSETLDEILLCRSGTQVESETLSRWRQADMSTIGVRRFTVKCSRAVAAAPELVNISEAGKIDFSCPEKDIPYGLCYLVVLESDGILTRRLLRLLWSAGQWRYENDLDRILGRKTDDRVVQVDIVPANEVTRTQFDQDEVRAFIEKLPVDDPQRSAAQRFFQLE